MKYAYLFLLLFVANFSFGQAVQSYQNSRGETHLCGNFPLAYLQQDTLYQNWYNESYDAFSLPEGNYAWKKEFANTKVDIYLGTWCGDSKRWVPAFVKLWDELGLDRSQLNFIALYDTDEKYKQGPEGEEKGKRIHRVPTFIFKDQDNQDEEYARIVEYPRNDLVTDMAQIALGYPSEPNYRAATYLMELFESNSTEAIKDDLRDHFYKTYSLVGKSKELNTLGYVYLYAGKIPEALTVFEFNSYIFNYEPNVYDSYAEALSRAGETDRAISNYEKVLSLDPENENALAKLKELKEE